MSRYKILMEYFKGMFIIDLLSSIPFGLMREDATYGALLKFLKVIRFFRLIKVFKVIKGLTLIKNFLRSDDGR